MSPATTRTERPAALRKAQTMPVSGWRGSSSSSHTATSGASPGGDGRMLGDDRGLADRAAHGMQGVVEQRAPVEADDGLVAAEPAPGAAGQHYAEHHAVRGPCP